MTAIDFLRKKGILSPDKTQWIILFEDGTEIDLVKVLDEYKNTVVDRPEFGIKLKTADHLFVENMKQGMMRFDERTFKREYRTMFPIIMHSMKQYAKQFVKFAIEESKVEANCENRSFHRLILFLERIKIRIN